jgi:alpha-N-arabinofuranosidase
MLITLLKHADRVKIACLAQLVNVIAPIMTVTGGGCWRQTIYYPYLHASRFGRGISLHLNIQSPCYESAEFGPVPFLEAAAVRNPENASITLFAVNRSMEAALPLEVSAPDLKGCTVQEHIVLCGNDVNAANTLAHPNQVAPRSEGDARIEENILHATLPRLSWNVIRLKANQPSKEVG